jgi:chemotaxis protein CheD
VVVGIGECAVSDRAGDVIVTHALGSCIAVCLWDGERRVAGLLHFLLPDSTINPQRAAEQPAAFADTGIPLLFQEAFQLGADKANCRVWLIGGAEVTGGPSGGGIFNIGRRNQLAARTSLSDNGVPVYREDVGGHAARTVNLWVADGRVQVTAGRGQTRDL